MNCNGENITKKVLMGTKKEFILKFIISIILRGMLMIIPIFYSYAINSISASDYNMAYMLIGISIGITIIYRFSEHFNQVFYYKLYDKLYTKYTDIAMSYTYKNSIYSLSRIKLGEFANIFNNDIDIICTFWATAVIRIVYLIELIFIYSYFFMTDIYVGFITIAISAIVLMILIKYGHKMEVLNQTRKDTLDKKTGILQEIFLGIKEIKSLNMIPAMNKRTESSTSTYLDANTKYNVGYNKNKFISLFIIEFFRLVLFMYGIYLISVGHMELGVLLIIYNYYSKLIENLNEVGTINMEFRNLNTSTQRFNKLLEYSMNDHPSNKKVGNDFVGKIVLENILYGNRERPYLDNISLSINPKSITAITGKIGNDKSGILDLLLRLNRQHTGSVLIDDIDINDYGDDDYYDLVSSAREQPVFFNITIKENLKIIEPYFPKIVAICKRLKIHNYIMNLKDGYDTVLNDANDNIATDVKRLLAIARVLLKDSKIMLFDDMMSTFDNEMISNILKILEEKKKEHTVVIIGRNEAILDVADKIIVVEDGEIVDEKIVNQLNEGETIETVI